MAALLTRNKIGHIGSLTSGGAVLAALLLLSGCGHYTYYSKANVPTQQIAQNLYECKQASMRNYSAGSLMSTPNVATSGNFASGSEPDEGMTNLCMQARGYTISDTPQSKQVSANEQINLGMQYYNGQGVTQDYAQARQWYEKAAAQGNANAQGNLGFFYDEGKSVPQDYAQAAKWYQKAAAQGIAMAQANLGRMYANGQGVTQDYAQARQWYAKAIAQGNAEGQFYLGWMYAYGQGVPQDLVQAYLWLSVAAAQGNKISAQERDKVVIKMTPAQIAEAQRLAQQCQAQNFKGC